MADKFLEVVAWVFIAISTAVAAPIYGLLLLLDWIGRWWEK